MDLQTFTAAVEAELQARRVAFEQRDVIAFAGDVWPLVLAEELPDPGRWAGLFLEAGHARAPAANCPTRPGG